MEVSEMHLLNPTPNFWVILQAMPDPCEYTLFIESGWKKGLPSDFKPGDFQQLIHDLDQCLWVRKAEIIGQQEAFLSVYPSAGNVWEIICQLEKLSEGWKSWTGKHVAGSRFEDYLETFYPESVPSFLYSPRQLRLFDLPYTFVWTKE
jgi:hypothetical protein